MNLGGRGSQNQTDVSLTAKLTLYLHSSFISSIALGDFEVLTLNDVYLDITPLFNRRDHRIKQMFLVSPSTNFNFRY
jgi:hypothetical protein